MTFDDDLEHFRRVSPFGPLVRDAGWRAENLSFRTAKFTSEDDLIARVLSVPGTIERWIALVPAASPRMDSFADANAARTPHTPAAHTGATAGDPAAPVVQEVYNLLSLGTKVSGWPGVAHGGAIATIIDEVFGFLMVVNQRVSGESGTMTAWLRTEYLKPVAVPADICVRVWVEKAEGRKRFLRGELLGGKDGKEVLCRGEGLFVLRRNEKL
jgi:acyl-coenzyme A thioesterase PaaI-like protein